jgi:hypothetical protein
MEKKQATWNAEGASNQDIRQYECLQRGESRRFSGDEV